MAKPGPKPLPRTKCSVDGCERIADRPAIGMCHMHYARRWRHGHTRPTMRARGTGTITSYGYVATSVDRVPIQMHRLIVERVIGRPLPRGTEVHHVNGDRADNRNENLVVCPSKAYHKLLHVRETALLACGNANYRKCPFCKEYDDPKNLRHNKSSRYFYHLSCKNQYRREQSKIRRETT